MGSTGCLPVGTRLGDPNCLDHLWRSLLLARLRTGSPPRGGEDFCCWKTSDFLLLCFSSSLLLLLWPGELVLRSSWRFRVGGGVVPPRSGLPSQGPQLSPRTFQNARESGGVRLSMWPATDSHRLLQCLGHSFSPVSYPEEPTGTRLSRMGLLLHLPASL